MSNRKLEHTERDTVFSTKLMHGRGLNQRKIDSIRIRAFQRETGGKLSIEFFFFFFLSSFELKLIHHGRVVKSDRQEARRRGSTTRCSSFSVQGTVMWGKHTRRGGLWRAKWRRIIVPRRKRSHKSLCVCVCRGLGHGVKGVRGNSSGNSYYADDY